MQQEYISRINTLFLQQDKLKCKNYVFHRKSYNTYPRSKETWILRMKAFQIDIFRVLLLNFLARALLNTSSVRNVFLSLITTDTKVEYNETIYCDLISWTA